MGRSDSKMLIAKIDARGKAEKEMLLFKVSTWKKYFGKLLKNPYVLIVRSKMCIPRQS